MFGSYAMLKVIKYYQKNTIQNQTNNHTARVKKSERNYFCDILNLFGIFKSTKTMQPDDIKTLEYVLREKINCNYIKVTKNKNKIDITISKKDLTNFKDCCSFAGISIFTTKNEPKTLFSNHNCNKIQLSQKNAKILLNELHSGAFKTLTFH